ncbi:effector-associated domain 2-containing protein [Kutzneria chonburiensis]|uniref:Effector-associated domain-containing protein n=1 Tax=Kutzneria chonburiensis TaxID=1483604 RepID=A0ABV6MMP0_9PSEU|nr:hypothetical protein [Kutzneria chonburiensis]
MSERQPSVYRAILVVDVESFSGGHRSEDHRRLVRAGLREMLTASLHGIGHDYEAGYHNDTGDGVVVFLTSDVPESRLVRQLPHELELLLREHNSRYADGAQIRLRVALHHGQVFFDATGASAAAVIHACRLVDSHPVRDALKRGEAPLSMIVSDDFYRHVVLGEPAAAPDSYAEVQVSAKETEAVGWLRGGVTQAVATKPDRRPLVLDVEAGVVRVVPGGERLVGQLVQAIRQSPSLMDATRTRWPQHDMRSAPDEALHALAEAFLRVPSMVDDMARRDVVEELPMQIRVSIPRSTRARTDVRAIVRTCMTRDGGLAALLTAVQRIEGIDSLDVDALHGDVVTILASLVDQD